MDAPNPPPGCPPAPSGVAWAAHGDGQAHPGEGVPGYERVTLPNENVPNFERRTVCAICADV